MFSSNLTLKATIQAEKVKEKEDNRMAARYVKIRALLDEAEKTINSANISRCLKNKLMAKHLKARKALDTELNVEEVIEIMTLIVTMINHEIRQDKEAIEATTTEMRKNLDTFYKYDYNKFLEKQLLPGSHPSKSTLRSVQPSSPDRSKTNSRLSWKRSPSEGSVRKPDSPGFSLSNNEGSVSQHSEMKSMMSQSTTLTVKMADVRDSRGESKISEEVVEEGSGEESALSDNDDVEIFKRDITSAGIESLEADEEEANSNDPAVKHSLETLTLTLSILKEVPTLILNKSQQDYLAPTMRATKRLLMTPHGCTALSGPLHMLKSAIDNGLHVIAGYGELTEVRVSPEKPEKGHNGPHKAGSSGGHRR